MHFPQRRDLGEALAGVLGRVRDDQPNALPELIARQVGPPVVQKQTLRQITPKRLSDSGRPREARR
eukprot:2601496-Rhodomonas_salina.2